MSRSDDVHLKVELQAMGARLERTASLKARAGGAGPADGVTLFLNDIVATVPTGARYVESSPYLLSEGDGQGRGLLWKDGEQYREVEFAAPPRFYSGITKGDVGFGKIALRHGRDAIGSTVAQFCVRTSDACSFCGIGLSAESGLTLPRKEPADIARVAFAAADEGFSHMVLTTGTTDLDECGILHLTRCARAVRESSSNSMKVHVQFEPPGDDELIERIAAVADSAAINMESFDPGVLSRLAPGKAATGVTRYERAWSRAVDAFGFGQVTCFIIAGLGEDPRSVAEGCALLTSLGVYPFVIPLRPIPGTPLETWYAPSSELMSGLYERAATIIESSGLRASECAAGCVRCGACSAITDW
jgi:radical SAM protein (TIGR04043 family)